MNTIFHSRAKVEFVRASDHTTENLSRLPQATDEAEAEDKPLKAPNQSKWTCALCLSTMSSKDVTAHKEGKRHMAALAQVGNPQSIPTATTTEDEAKPLSNPNESRWTCALCITTMSSNDTTAHKKGKRHMAALAQVGNPQSMPTATTTEDEAKPLNNPNESRWTCALCITTMSSSDITAHKKGKRHMAALEQVGNLQSTPTATTTEDEAKPPSTPNESRWTCTLCFTTMSSNDTTAHKKGKRHTAAVEKASNLHYVPTATPSLEPNSPKREPSAPPTASAMDKTKPLSPSKSPAKAKKKKGNTGTNSKMINRGLVPPPISAYLDDWQSDEESSGSLHHPSFFDRYVNASDYSICDKDCGWCGKCMNKVSIDFDSINSVSAARSRLIPRVRSPLNDDNDPLAAFFALYGHFKYNPSNASYHEYRRLSTCYGWPTRKKEKTHTQRDDAWDNFRIAMVKAFNITFGDDENDIEAWGRMCVLVGIERIPDTLEARRKAMIQTHVNLCDLLDTTRQRSEVKVFSSSNELRLYTINTGKFFPKVDAYAGGLLKYLLREITGTYEGNRTMEGRKRMNKGRKGKK